MNKDIEDLIEVYAHKDDYQERIAAAATKMPFPDIAEALNLKDKINFGKDRQRAEMLKQNDVFLKELTSIKERLGEKFFKMLEIPADDLACYEKTIAESGFAEPIIVVEITGSSRFSESPCPYYFPVDAPEIPDDPCDDPAPPEFSIKLAKDSLFKDESCALEYDIARDYGDAEIWGKGAKRQIDFEWLHDPSFLAICKVSLFEKYCRKWKGFLDKWHISYNWNGDLESLHFHSLPSVIVEIDAKNYNLPVVVRIGAWATREDVGAAWPAVEEKMKEARVYRERESDNFLRDQIWYKQNKDLGMTPLQIAREWAKRFPKEIDLEVIEKLTRDEETFMDVPPQEVLEEVLSDDKLAELKGRFIEAHKAYISTGLRDRVKKSLQATEKKIKRLGSEDWDRNRERVLKPVHERREK